jgi:hypothetical protein
MMATSGRIAQPELYSRVIQRTVYSEYLTVPIFPDRVNLTEQEIAG